MAFRAELARVAFVWHPLLTSRSRPRGEGRLERRRTDSRGIHIATNKGVDLILRKICSVMLIDVVDIPREVRPRHDCFEAKLLEIASRHSNCSTDRAQLFRAATDRW